MQPIAGGGKRDVRVAQKLKQEGVRPGVPDLVLPVARSGYIGLFIEMKTKTGAVSPAQRDYMALLQQAGHQVHVCRSVESAIAVMQAYLQGERHA